MYVESDRPGHLILAAMEEMMRQAWRKGSEFQAGDDPRDTESACMQDVWDLLKRNGLKEGQKT